MPLLLTTTEYVLFYSVLKYTSSWFTWWCISRPGL